MGYYLTVLVMALIITCPPSESRFLEARLPLTQTPHILIFLYDIWIDVILAGSHAAQMISIMTVPLVSKTRLGMFVVSRPCFLCNHFFEVTLVVITVRHLATCISI